MTPHNFDYSDFFTTLPAPVGDPPEPSPNEQIKARFEQLDGMITRLQAERNRRVEATELGKLSEELDADNWGSAATLVRSVMHEREDLIAAMLAVEWAGTDHDCRSCVSCGAVWEAGNGHRPNCQLDAALRKAGVR